MRNRQILSFILFSVSAFSFQSCQRTGSDVWEDTKSAGRYMNRGVKTLIGTPGDSRQIHSRSDFECIEDENNYPEGNFQECDYQENSYSPHSSHQPLNMSEDFIPLHDPTNELCISDFSCRPPSETPGDPGSSIPGIQAFRDPSTIPHLVGIFRPIYFEYDSSLIKGQQNLQIVHSIADYMRYHPQLYVFIEGHTDERGPQAYNLALGSRRANAIRQLLVSEGINPDRLFTISYGKERPVILERHEEGWSKNRRGEFKIYER